jgi:hypothetical protein
MRERISKMLKFGIGLPQSILSLLAVCCVLDRHQDRPCLRIRIEDFARVEQHYLPSDVLKVVCHLKVPKC